MGNSLSVRLRGIFQNKKEESWWERVTENARAFFALRGTRAFAHGGAGAFDLLEQGPAPGTRQRQAVSILVHGVVVGLLLLLAGRVAKGPTDAATLIRTYPPLTYSEAKHLPPKQAPESGNGAGGDKNVLPPTNGDWAARAAHVILHPRLPDDLQHPLVVEPTVFDPTANDVHHVENLGLPNMKDRNGSNGQNGDDGMGNKPGHSMGTHNGIEEGESAYDGPPLPGMKEVRCLYCPDPEYTDEARHEKLQGSVTLRVLVTADGRAAQVKIVRGLGFGLDERAMDKVRIWRFEPARDANRRAIAQWITVEATYRLF